MLTILKLVGSRARTLGGRSAFPDELKAARPLFCRGESNEAGPDPSGPVLRAREFNSSYLPIWTCFSFSVVFSASPFGSLA
jgi:hypothetical protein